MWLCLVVHVAAIALMLTVLGPGLLAADSVARRAFVASASIGWGVGWCAWALATFTLILVFMAWADTLAFKGWGWLAVAIALAGGLVDWGAEVVWMFLAPTWAHRGVSDSFHEQIYGLWERAYQVIAVGLANLLYCVAGLILTAAASKTKTFPRWLARSSAAVWIVSLGLSYPGFAGRTAWIKPIGTVALVAFLPWVMLLGYGWLRARHPLPASEALRRGSSFRETLRAIVPKHPVAMKTLFRDCFLVNFAVEPDVMRRLLPRHIDPALHDGEAYLSVVIANMDRMRPAFLPRSLGITYNQVVYRIVVRCRGEAGVHFLRSDADHRLMNFAGDWLTFFRFHHARVMYRSEGGLLHFDLGTRPGDHADIHATFDLASATTTMPATSRFKTLAEAQVFLVELFAAFAHDPLTDEISTVRIQRGDWNIQVVEDRRACYELMNGSGLFPAGSTRLDSVFYAKELPYYWHTLERPGNRRFSGGTSRTTLGVQPQGLAMPSEKSTHS